MFPNCEGCGLELDRVGVRYCGHVCRVRAWRARRVRGVVVRLCGWCGAAHTRSGQARYCSRSCGRRAWRHQNAERINAQMRGYRMENPGRYRDYDTRSRLKRAGQGETCRLPDDMWWRLWGKQQGLCGLCKGELRGPVEVDHVVPLSKGGKHEEGNVQLAHRSCNRRKGASYDGDVLVGDRVADRGKPDAGLQLGFGG